MNIGAQLARIQARIDALSDLAAEAPVAGRMAALNRGADGGYAGPPVDPQAAGRFQEMMSDAMRRGGPGELGAIGGAAVAVAPQALEPIIARNAAQYGVEPALVKAVIAQESGFRADAVSPVGAQGLMQLMPQTAAGLGVTNSFDPEQNIAGGTRYLRGLYDRFHDWRLAVAAYNAGPGAVTKYGGVPPYAETQNYVSAVMGARGGYAVVAAKP